MNPMSLDQHRKAIDSLDEKIIALLNERTRHALKIGVLKMEAGEEIYAPHRELEVLDRICKTNPGPVPNESLRAIYREIMSCSLAIEKSMTIAYLGPEATFTHLAAIRRFGSSLHYSAQKSIADVFNEVAKNRADYGVAPVENSTEGVVTHTLDMFVESDLKIVAQIILPIQHCLVSNAKIEAIRKVYSHPQALAQCRAWLQNRLPHAEVVETSSTTRAAELTSAESNSAAISSSLAAERYHLPILESDIQDNSQNATRFLVLGRQCSPPTGRDRTSIMLSISHEVGALHRALEPFRRNKLNMTRIESRPNKRKAWEYFFFIDFDGHFQEEKSSRTIEQLGKRCGLVKILGSYPNTD
jgi:chorismate mutase / prephenate dehydratase